jgi:hypothetical protein
MDELQHVLNLNIRIVKIRNVDYIEGISIRDSWPEKGTTNTVRISEVNVPGTESEQRQLKYSPDHAGYSKFPTVDQASENPLYWQEKFSEWAPSLNNIRIKND